MTNKSSNKKEENPEFKFADMKLEGYSHHNFEKLDKKTKKDVLQRLNLLNEEFEKRKTKNIFAKDFLEDSIDLSPLLNILISIKEDSVLTILDLLFEKVRADQGQNEEYNKAAISFVELVHRMGFKGDNFKDLNDTIMFQNLLSQDVYTKTTETLNWELTRIRAEYMYGINLGEYYDAFESLGNLNYLLSYFKSELLFNQQRNTHREEDKKELHELEKELENLDVLWGTRYGLDSQDIVNRKGISLIGGIKETTVENASIRGELETIDGEGEKKKNFEFTAVSASNWLTDKKRQNRKKRYFPTLRDEQKDILALPINDKEDLENFIKEKENEVFS